MKKIVISLFLAVLAFSVFAEDITPPKLVHSPVKQAMVNSPVEIDVTVSDVDSPIDVVTLFYRQVGEDGFVAIPMQNVMADAERFSAEIPAADVTLANIEYFIRAADEGGNTATYPEVQAMENPFFIKCVESGEKNFYRKSFCVVKPRTGN